MYIKNRQSRPKATQFAGPPLAASTWRAPSPPRFVRHCMAILARGETKSSRTMWQILRKKPGLPAAGRALPGRAARAFTVPTKHFVNGNRIQPPFPAGLEQAMFGMGCFWGAERKFWEASGVYTTAVGYAACLTPNPTYEEGCSGQTRPTPEVMVWFDPATTSYQTRLQPFP